MDHGELVLTFLRVVQDGRSGEMGEMIIVPGQ